MAKWNQTPLKEKYYCLLLVTTNSYKIVHKKGLQIKQHHMTRIIIRDVFLKHCLNVNNTIQRVFHSFLMVEYQHYMTMIRLWCTAVFSSVCFHTKWRRWMVTQVEYVQQNHTIMGFNDYVYFTANFTNYTHK